MTLPNLDNKPADWFPPSNTAQQNGLLCYGGSLTTERLIAAYRRGIFPCPHPDLPQLWWTTNPRMVLAPSRLHIGKTLTKELRRHPWQITTDNCCDKVITACAQHRKEGSWITQDISQAYNYLHTLGYVHSIEVWLHDQLVGGLYGVALGKIFFGESLFSRKSNAAKIALLACTRMLVRLGYVLIDCQMESKLLLSLGARNISRSAFEYILARNIITTAPGSWDATLIDLPPQRVTPPPRRITPMPLKVTETSPYIYQLTNSSGAEITLTATPELTGGFSGIRPTEALPGALATCTSIDLRVILEKQRQKLESLEVIMQVQRDEDQIPKVIRSIELTFKLTGTLEQDKVKRALELASQKYCTVYKHLMSTIAISYSLEVNGEAC